MIGVFGGTFDPVHYGHLRSALEVKEIFDLAEVRMIPSADPPHRDRPAASAQMRAQMLKLAIANQPGLVCDGRELERKGPSYMVDTLESLQKDFSEQSLLLFIGCDAFNSLTSWHQWRRLFDFAHIVVLTRPDFDTKTLDEFLALRQVFQKQDLQRTQAGKLFFQAVTPLDISASGIRAILASRKSPAFLLPDAVFTFIKQHHLYE
jgi:nicotinate-nucleotide adenylyltransferase